MSNEHGSNIALRQRPPDIAIGPEREHAATAGELRAAVAARPVVRGKFLYLGDEKYWVKGVTYGTFRPQEHGQFPDPEQVERDFVRIAQAGFNTVRVYTAPKRWLLDLAFAHGLRVIVGLWWEQNVAFLDDSRRERAIVAKFAASVRMYAGHPAVLAYALGNEIPSAIVRWHGRRRIERFLAELYRVTKAEDPQALVTYVNFPTTEYLRLPFLDFVCFNVYLESREELEAYLARLQNLAGEKPLLMAEMGLDSRRNGEARQAETLTWQIETTFAAGCIGTTVFAWTDDWHCGGRDIEDWDFGLTTRDRRAKPALAAVSRALGQVPFAPRRWPRVSVVVASYNGARTIRDTLDALQRLAYPDFEVIVVNDGSTDATRRIAAQYPVRLISTPNMGLSHARNVGWRAATGDIVAYIDDDAYPDPHWLHYLAHRFETGHWVGVGGPNIAPPGDGPIAECVANAPGGPVHVLLTDAEAEHIPGCNMAFRRDALEAIGGFDPRFRTAGDDVDVCWRLQERGGRIGFHAGAMDWHHRRDSVAMYWRQQKGYGRAEALLEAKWPQRYSAYGHLAWQGRLYGRGLALPIPSRRARVYSGVWGTAGYQSLYSGTPATLVVLPLMPEWYFIVALLGVLALLSRSWHPLVITVPIFLAAAAAPIVQAAYAAVRAQFPNAAASPAAEVQRRLLTFWLHLIQPLARLTGRLNHGLTPWRWRRRGARALDAGGPAARTLWSERWQPPAAWAARIESALVDHGAIVQRGSVWDEWDLAVRGGAFGGAHVQIAVEEHGGGKQLVRTRVRSYLSTPWCAAAIAFALLSAFAFADHAWFAGISLAGLCVWLSSSMWRDIRAAIGYWAYAVDIALPAECRR